MFREGVRILDEFTQVVVGDKLVEECLQTNEGAQLATVSGLNAHQEGERIEKVGTNPLQRQRKIMHQY